MRVRIENIPGSQDQVSAGLDAYIVATHTASGGADVAVRGSDFDVMTLGSFLLASICEKLGNHALDVMVIGADRILEKQAAKAGTPSTRLAAEIQEGR